MKTAEVYIPALQSHVTCYIGQNAKDNEAVIDQMETPHDLWFHAGAGISSCHVVCIYPTEPISKAAHRQIIHQGALLCKLHTAKLRVVSNAEIIYAPVSTVKKTPVAGQVIVHKTKSVKV